MLRQAAYREGTNMKSSIGIMLLLCVVLTGCRTLRENVCRAPAQVELELQTLSIESATFAALARDKLLSAEGLAQLQAAGKLEIQSTLVVLTEAGEQTTIKSTKEWRYPQSYESDNGDKSKQDSTRQKTVSGGFIGNTLPVTVFAPADFQTREVGHIFNVTPSIAPDGRIWLTMVPEITGEPTWENFGPELAAGAKEARSAQMKQPIFSTATLTSKIFIRNGQRILIGACPAPLDNKQTLVFILSARILN